MFRKLSSLVLTLALVLGGGLIPLAEASTPLASNVATINLTATVSPSLTVSVDTASLNFTSAAYSSPVHISVAWNLPAGAYQNLDLAVFFNTSTALSSPSTGATIPVSQFYCIDGIGTNPFTASQVLGGGTIPLLYTCPGDYSVNITSANLTGNATLPYQFGIPSLLAYSAANDYTGQIQIEAWVW
jgi:hypothetical protein